MKVRNIILPLVLVISFFSCKKDAPPHDAKKQAIEDNKAILTYLETHYLGEDGALRTIKNNERPLKDNVKSKTVTENEIDYKLYYLTTKKGIGSYAKETDSVYMAYSGILLDSTVFQPYAQSWMYLKRYVTGFEKGATLFKSGVLKMNPDESFYYENTGQGYVFIPSGLAYKDRGTSSVPKNASLIFKFEIKDIKVVKTEEK